jgi:uncharacterized membrane protein YdjX (TVP38/TMEM64 family)
MNYWSSLGRAALIGLGILVLLVAGHELELHLGELERDLEQLGSWAPLGFIAAFTVLAPLWFSVDALCFIAGLLFPLLAGELYMMVATYISAASIFVLGRKWFKAKLSDWLQRQAKLSKLNAVLRRQLTFKLMFLLRLTPLPFALLSYAFATAPVRFWPYLSATSGIFLYNATLVYLGYTTKHLVGFAAGEKMAIQVPYPLLAFGLVLMLSIMVFVSKRADSILNGLNDGDSQSE